MTGIADLDAMDRAALRSLWSRTLDAPVPAKASRDFLRRVLAFELQARRHGGLSARTRKDLETTARQADAAPADRDRPLRRPAPGTRLVREWNGTTHVVEVTEDGVLWQGRTWSSLSAVAREITGARWSGPRFFGLTGKAR